MSHVKYKMDVEHFINEMTHKSTVFKILNKSVMSLSIVWMVL